MGTQRLSSADAAWLHMDRPTNLMIVNSVLLLDGPLDLDRLREVFTERLVAAYPRYRQRVVESRVPLRGPAWEDDPSFDIDDHIHHVGLPQPGDEAALQELIGELISTTLDHDKPLWDVYVIDGSGPGPALLVRMHHCIADGIALARVMMSLTDGEIENPAAFADERPAPASVVRLPGPVASVAGAAASTVSAGGRLASTVAHQTVESVLHPRHAADLAKTAVEDTAALARMVFMSSDADTALRGELHRARCVTWTRPIPLSQVKEIAHANKATVNDVLLAAVSGGLREYLLGRGEQPASIRAIVPFNLRPLDQPVPRELGNRFGLVFLPLPVDVDGREERLAQVKRGMDQIKDSPDAGVSYAVLGAIGLTPTEVETRLVNMFSSKGTAVMTNVPGPQRPVALAGAHIERVLVWAPTSGSVGMSVSIFSYEGQVTIGLLADAHLIRDPDAIVRAVEDEFTALAGSPATS